MSNLTAPNFAHEESNGADMDDFVLVAETLPVLFEPSGAMLSPDSPEFREQFDAEIAKLMQPDRNGDGRIDGAEMLAFAKQRLAAATPPANAMIAALMAHPEGPFTEARFLAAADALFRRVDTDGDGTISREEIEAARRR